MKIARFAYVALSVIVALLAAAGGLAMVGQAPDAQAAPREMVSTSTTWVALLARNVTTTQTSEEKYLPNYESADCYANIVQSAANNTTTVKMQHGALTDLWADAVTIGSSASDTTFFTRAVPYGNYQRFTVTPFTSTVPFTATIVCVEKN